MRVTYCCNNLGASLIGRIPTNGVVSRSLIMRDNPSDIYIDLPSPLPADGMFCVYYW